jgi:hypothetical protein
MGDGLRMRRSAYSAVPLKLSLSLDIESRLTGLGHAIAAASPDVRFAYLFGSTATGEGSPRSDIISPYSRHPGRTPWRAAVRRPRRRPASGHRCHLV